MIIEHSQLYLIQLFPVIRMYCKILHKETYTVYNIISKIIRNRQ